MNSMNPYQGYDYVFQINNPGFPIKDEPFCDFDVDREEQSVSPQAVLPYMNTFAKHGTPGIPMFYQQLPFEYHPFLLNQRRRSSPAEKYPDPYESLDEPSNFSSPFSNVPLKDNLPRFKPKQRAVSKRKSVEQEEFTVSDGNPNSDGSSPDSTKVRKTFHCRSCGKFFKFQTSLLRHNNKVHISKYQCPTCSRVFSRQAYLDVHTSKQGSSCYLDPSQRMARRNHALAAIC